MDAQLDPRIAGAASRLRGVWKSVRHLPAHLERDEPVAYIAKATYWDWGVSARRWRYPCIVAVTDRRVIVFVRWFGSHRLVSRGLREITRIDAGGRLGPGTLTIHGGEEPVKLTWIRKSDARHIADLVRRTPLPPVRHEAPPPAPRHRAPEPRPRPQPPPRRQPPPPKPRGGPPPPPGRG